MLSINSWLIDSLLFFLCMNHSIQPFNDADRTMWPISTLENSKNTAGHFDLCFKLF